MEASLDPMRRATPADFQKEQWTANSLVGITPQVDNPPQLPLEGLSRFGFVVPWGTAEGYVFGFGRWR